MELIGCLAIILVMIILAVAVVEEILKKRKSNIIFDDGVHRYLRLCEYSIGRKRIIRTDHNYMLYSCVAGSVMENKEVEFNIDRKGFIEPSEIYENAQLNIAFVGDSTTECALVEPELRYPYLVGRLFQKENHITVNSYNAGFSSATSFSMLTTVLYKILPLAPKAIIWCSNISDLVTLLNNKTWTDAYRTQEKTFFFEKDLSKNIVWRLKSVARTLFPNFYTLLYSKKESVKSDGHQNNETMILRKLDENDKKRIKKQIMNNMKLFLEICYMNEIIPVICTQASIWNWGGISQNARDIEIYKMIERKARISYREFVLLFEEVNETIREYCKKNKIAFADLEIEIPKSNEFIYDYVHYTDKGSQKVAECVYAVINHIF